MLGRTHIVIGLTALAAVETGTQIAGGLVQPHPVAGIPTGPLLCLGAAAVGALLPDLDANESTIQQQLGVAGELAHSGMNLLGLKHRGVLHSGLATIIVLVLSAYFGYRLGYVDAGLALSLGYASHVVIADAMTISGVPLFWPAARRFHLLPRPLRVRTAGPAEWLVFLVMTAIFIWLLPAMFPANIIELLFSWLAWL
jgi:membrane-bound metal-dependent hydrolase YbcI (DUF457 family)